jgi:hypothetical protein
VSSPALLATIHLLTTKGQGPPPWAARLGLGRMGLVLGRMCPVLGLMALLATVEAILLSSMEGLLALMPTAFNNTPRCPAAKK